MHPVDRRRQMVEIAKAVMTDARVIALDEPTSSLSSRESEILFALIERLRSNGTVILYVSHRLDEIFRLCDSLTVLRDGRLAAHHPDISKVGREQIIAEMVGREIRTSGLARPDPRSCDAFGGRRFRRHPAPTDQLCRPRRRDSRLLRLIGAAAAKWPSGLWRRSPAAGQGPGGRRRRTGEQPAAVDPCWRCSVPGRQEVRWHRARALDRGEHGDLLPPSFLALRNCRQGKEADLAERFIAKLRVRTPSRHQDIVNLSGGTSKR